MLHLPLHPPSKKRKKDLSVLDKNLLKLGPKLRLATVKKGS